MKNDFSLEKSLEGFTRFPQTLINLKVDDPNKIILSDRFWSKVTQIEKTLGDQGRVLIRPSGTEPLIRITVEGEDLKNVVEQTSVLVKKVSAIIN